MCPACQALVSSWISRQERTLGGVAGALEERQDVVRVLGQVSGHRGEARACAQTGAGATVDDELPDAGGELDGHHRLAEPAQQRARIAGAAQPAELELAD